MNAEQKLKQEEADKAAEFSRFIEQELNDAMDSTSDTLEIFISKLCSNEPGQAVSEALCRVVAAHIVSQDDPSAAYEEFGVNIAEDIAAHLEAAR